MRRSAASRLFVLSWLLAGAPILAQPGLRVASGRAVSGDPRDDATVPASDELLVNTVTSYQQRNPDVAARGNGDFVVVWEHQPLDDPFQYEVVARRFASTGAAIGSPFQVNTFTEQFQGDPHLGMRESGDFVVVWWSSQGVALNPKVIAQRFGSNGSPVGGEMQVNIQTTNSHDNPDVAMAADGRFLVVWEAFPVDGSDNAVLARLFDSSGSALATEVQLNLYTPGNQDFPAVAVDGNGAFVVVWRSAGQDGSGDGVFGRRVDADGAPVGGELQVNAFTSLAQFQPQVAAASDGSFMVAWSSLRDGSPFGVFARGFSSSGAPVAGEFQVNDYTLYNQIVGSIAAVGSEFVVTWGSYYQDGDASGAFARRFEVDGSARTLELQVNTFTPNHQAFPAVDGDGVGGFVVAWDSVGQDGDDRGIFARRYVTLALLDVDADQATTALTDGILLLRYLFGFTGAALTSGAVGSSCGRCSQSELLGYLTTLLPLLDVDGDGAIGPLTDGILVLRYLFGFTDAVLTSGAVAQSCTRCDGAAVIAYLDGLS